jgi:hypothetical protein
VHDALYALALSKISKTVSKNAEIRYVHSTINTCHARVAQQQILKFWASWKAIRVSTITLAGIVRIAGNQLEPFKFS